MTLRELRCFIEVVMNNGFAHVTETLHVTQPAISRAIRQLETEFGGNLLVRKTRGIQLTDRGRMLLHYAENILQKEQELHSKLANLQEDDTTLKVGLPPFISAAYFPKILYKFRQSCPRTRLEIIEMPTPQLEHALRNGKIEIAAAMLPVDSIQYKWVKFDTDSLVLVVPRDHPLNQSKNVSLSDLYEEPLVLLTEHFKINELIYHAFSSSNVIPKIVGRSSSFDFVTDMIRCNMGISLLPGSIWKNTMATDLSIIPLREPALCYDIGLIRNKRQFVSQVCKKWIDISADILHFDIPAEFIL